MPSKDDFVFALENISRWGDTDVFPFAPENHILFDKSPEIADILLQVDADLGKAMDHDAPVNQTALQLVSYEGFRWVSQLDPLWNAYLLGAVYSAQEKIEAARLTLEKRRVFSYRFNPDTERKSLFRDNAWSEFVDEAEKQAKNYSHVVVTDIADFYGRLYHHRIENALSQIGPESGLPKKVDQLLRAYSGGGILRATRRRSSSARIVRISTK
jgi:hypothetical protein